MTDSLNAYPPVSQASSNWMPPGESADPGDLQITLTLPAEVVAAIQQASQPFPDQSLSQQLVALLRQAMKNGSPAEAVDIAQESHPSSDSSFDAERSLRQELDQIKQRLSLLEALLPGLAGIPQKLAPSEGETAIAAPIDQSSAAAEKGSASAPPAMPDSNPVGSDGTEAALPSQAVLDGDGNPGSAVASIWMQVQQNDRPPASIPSTLQPTEPCPQCQQRLMPFKSSGRAVCIGCGWTKSLSNEAENASDVADLDVHRLLEQAAAESLENMKPRKRSP